MASAQNHKIPVIKASALSVNIKDDNDPVRQNAWTIVPAEKLDVYITSAKKVTFFTDKESISFKIDPKVGEYNFIILVNGKDTARTQIKYDAKAPSRRPIAYLDTLRKAEKYNYKDNREVPKFSYQSMEDPNLVKIRKDLKLDSIAGKGNELSKVFNLLHWVHNLVRHDGSSNNPSLQNAIDLIKVCREENRALIAGC